MFAKLLDKYVPARRALYCIGIEDAALNWNEMNRRVMALERSKSGGTHLASASIYKVAEPARKGDVLLRSSHPSYVRGFLYACEHMNERKSVRFFYKPLRQQVDRIAPGNYVIAKLA
jgi:hypothetical protein